ncbi:hypothetical protein ACQ4LE_010475 [Meloidogyne hapla]
MSSAINILFFIFSTLLLFNYVYNKCVMENQNCENSNHNGNPCCQKPKKLNCVENINQKTHKRSYICLTNKCTYDKQCNNNVRCCYGSQCIYGKCQPCLGGTTACSNIPCCSGKCKEGQCTPNE